MNQEYRPFHATLDERGHAHIQPISRPLHIPSESSLSSQERGWGEVPSLDGPSDLLGESEAFERGWHKGFEDGGKWIKTVTILAAAMLALAAAIIVTCHK